MLSIIYEDTHHKGHALEVNCNAEAANKTAPSKMNVIKFKSFEVRFSPIKPIYEQPKQKKQKFSKNAARDDPSNYVYHSRIGIGAYGTVRLCIPKQELFECYPLFKLEKLSLAAGNPLMTKTDSSETNCETEPGSPGKTITKLREEVERKVLDQEHCKKCIAVKLINKSHCIQN